YGLQIPWGKRLAARLPRTPRPRPSGATPPHTPPARPSRMAAARLARMASPRSRSPLFIAIVAAFACYGALLVLAMAIVIGVVVWNGSSGEPGPEASSASDGLVLPPGVAEGQPYLEVGTSEDGPVVDVYVDFLCPHCATFHDAQGEDRKSTYTRSEEHTSELQSRF